MRRYFGATKPSVNFQPRVISSVYVISVLLYVHAYVTRTHTRREFRVYAEIPSCHRLRDGGTTGYERQ